MKHLVFLCSEEQCGFTVYYLLKFLAFNVPQCSNSQYFSSRIMFI